mmetsp:Transcript_12213/g.28669  ORF Transcript_12213/g.28669 Transcript_12213/m.28669 type:complete len:275 (+) Transcript_12213:11-835(+)
MSYETVQVDRPAEFVARVTLNRPRKGNAMNRAFWREFREAIKELGDSDARVIIVAANGKHFTVGLDLVDFGSMGSGGDSEEEDPARKAFRLRNSVLEMQETFSVLEKVRQPVVAAVHGACVGGGVDLITACDVRLCSREAWFCVKEVDIGITADVGTLQRLPKVIGNQSACRELCYTGRRFDADEALSIGLVSHLDANAQDLNARALHIAKDIASKSPLTLAGIKEMLNYSRDHSVEDGLKYVATWNGGMLSPQDMMEAMQANSQKKPAQYARL